MQPSLVSGTLRTMSEAVQIEVVRQLPAILAGTAAVIGAVFGFINRQSIKDVHRELNSALVERVSAANSQGRIQERSEQRQADKDIKSLG